MKMTNLIFLLLESCSIKRNDNFAFLQRNGVKI